MKELRPNSQENETRDQEMTPGEALRLIRKERGLTLEKLGKIIGISTSSLGMIETGERRIFSVLPKLIEGLQLGPEEIDILVNAGAVNNQILMAIVGWAEWKRK